ncbi:unnamed protein product [Larinioides sclopetarius]|uniref:Uncharacterized protein n=1 Tax=Larinioides sclopetarius TaxID=280406 RepID=A0AAV2BJJ7_9ARAC
MLTGEIVRCFRGAGVKIAADLGRMSKINCCQMMAMNANSGLRIILGLSYAKMLSTNKIQGYLDLGRNRFHEGSAVFRRS